MHSKKTTWKNSLTLNGERKCFHITCFLRLRQPQPWWNTTPTLMKHNPNLDGTQHCMSMSLHVFFATFGRYEPLGHAPRDVNRMPTDSLYSHLILKALVYLTSSLLRTNKKPRKKTPAHQPHHTNPPFPPFPPKKRAKSFANSRAKNPSPGKGSTFRRGLWWTHDTGSWQPRVWSLLRRSYLTTNKSDRSKNVTGHSGHPTKVVRGSNFQFQRGRFDSRFLDSSVS